MTGNIFIVCSLLAMGSGASLGLADENALRVTLRLVVLTDSDGSNAAASHKQIEQQLAVLRNDAARQGVSITVKAMTFVADSARRNADASALARDADKTDAAFANAKDEVVVYVTSLGKATTSRYVLRRGADSSFLPAIIIDASEFGGQGCGPGRDKPCRTLSCALGDAMTLQSDVALRTPGEAMRNAATRSEE